MSNVLIFQTIWDVTKMAHHVTSCRGYIITMCQWTTVSAVVVIWNTSTPLCSFHIYVSVAIITESLENFLMKCVIVNARMLETSIVEETGRIQFMLQVSGGL